MVRPQAILVFLPITTPGTEAILKPETSNGQASESVRQWRPTWANTDGIEVGRCGSLDKIALPLAVPDPATAQEFEPISPAPEPLPKSRGIDLLILATLSSAPVAFRS